MKNSPELQSAMDRALDFARQQKHIFATVEHLLAGLLEEPRVAEIIGSCSGSVEKIKQNIAMRIKCELRELVDENCDTVLHAGSYQRVLGRANAMAKAKTLSETPVEFALIHIFRERASRAICFLEEQGVTRYKVANHVAYHTKTSVRA